MKKIVITLVLAMLVMLTACGIAGSTALGHSVLGKQTGFGLNGNSSLTKPDTSVTNTEEDYEFDTSKSFAIGVVKYTDMPDGYRYDGIGMEEFASGQGQKSWGFECEILYYYNYSRMREISESYGSDVLYHYFSIGRLPRWISKTIVDDNKANNTDIFTGEMVSEEEYLSQFSDFYREHYNTELTYEFHIDWNYRNEIKEGDIILISLDPQMSINRNSGTASKWCHAMISPFTADGSRPYLAKFVDGKLQLPEKLKDSLNLYRLYNDTEPERTAIKDGDTVDDVIAFIKCVEQDVARYKEANK